MPRKLWQIGLEHGLNRITRDSLLGLLTGEQKDLWAVELTTEEPIEKESIKARLLTKQVSRYAGWHREAPLEQRFPMKGRTIRRPWLILAACSLVSVLPRFALLHRCRLLSA